MKRQLSQTNFLKNTGNEAETVIIKYNENTREQNQNRLILKPYELLHRLVLFRQKPCFE